MLTLTKDSDNDWTVDATSTATGLPLSGATVTAELERSGSLIWGPEAVTEVGTTGTYSVVVPYTLVTFHGENLKGRVIVQKAGRRRESERMIRVRS